MRSKIGQKDKTFKALFGPNWYGKILKQTDPGPRSNLALHASHEFHTRTLHLGPQAFMRRLKVLKPDTISVDKGVNIINWYIEIKS